MEKRRPKQKLARTATGEKKKIPRAPAVKKPGKRLQAEKAVHQTELRYRQLMDYVIFPVTVTAIADGRVLYANPRAAEFFGVPLKEAGGQQARDFWARPVERNRFMAALAKHGQLENIEFEVKTKSGEPRQVLVSALIIEYQGVQAAFLIYNDISERKRAEEATRESEEKFRTLAEQSPNMIFINFKGRVVYANQASIRIMGYHREEFYSKNFDFMKITAPECHDLIRAKFLQHQKGEEVEPYEYALLTRDGRRINVINSPALIDYQGEKAILGIVTDISERKRIEEKLRWSQQLFLTIFRSNPAPSMLSSLDDGVCFDVNDAYCRLSGYDRDEMIGRKTVDFGVWNSIKERKKIISELARKGRISNIELTIQKKSGEFLPVLGSGEVITLDDVPYILSFYFDISDIRRLEQERIEWERRLLHAQKLESLGLLAGGIAHDFNNLLMAVLGNLDFTIQEVALPAAAKFRIGQAMQAASRATDLTRQMLAYSGKGQFEIRRLDLNDLVRENAALFRTAIPKTIVMTLNLSPGLALIEADSGQLQQVIMNLITNAAEAIGDFGEITLTTIIRDCDQALLGSSRLAEKPEPGRFVFLEIADTGSGMDANTQARLFDPFFTTKFAGRGLGLSAVLGIVRGHRGAILIDSAANRGTTIRVLFPSCPDQSLPESPAEEAGKQEMTGAEFRGSVLVVDDEKMVRDLSASFLHHLGFQTITAADGAEAMELFRTHADRISLVLLDLTMPHLDGVNACHQMKILHPEIPIILCSGYNSNEATQRFTSEGLAGFLQKPFRLHDLKKIIAQALQRPTTVKSDSPENK